MAKTEIDLNRVNAAMDDQEMEDDAQEINATMGSNAEEVRNAPKKRIIIHNQEGGEGNQPVFVAVNGMGYSLPREKPILVPVPIVVALENASETRYYRDETDGQKFGPVLERTVRRIPFSFLGG